MTPTVYAAYTDATQAELAASALLDRGVDPKQISLVINEEKRSEKAVNATAASAPIVEENLDEGLNPAQNDYPRTMSDSPTELTSAPPNAVRMYNTELEKENYAHPYDANVEKEIERDYAKDRSRANDLTGAAESDRSVPSYEQTPTPAVPIPDGDVAAELDEAGVSRPTISSTEAAVAASAGLGIGAGALAAVAALTLPGIGLVVGGGALATAVVALAASSKTGAVAEGVGGYLKDQGVPAEAIPELRLAYEHGGAILGVAIEGSPADHIELQSILRSFGATQVGAYGNES